MTGSDISIHIGSYTLVNVTKTWCKLYPEYNGNPELALYNHSFEFILNDLCKNVAVLSHEKISSIDKSRKKKKEE